MSGTLKHAHGQWRSRIGFLLAATGSAIGLGNIWKFPYMTGTNGGSAFVLTYLLCIALVGFPLLVAEWLIGRRGQKNPMLAIEDVAKQNNQTKAWGIVGLVAIIAGFLVLSFYSVIGGWAIDYIFITLKGTFSGMSGDDTDKVFTDFLANPKSLLLWHTVFMALTIGIIAMGVSSGIERASKIMMPGLAIILLIMLVYVIFSTDTFGKGVSFLFAPDWSKINGQSVLAALGHAFFTLSLGMGIMFSYGSYLGKEINLLKTARSVIILDTIFALAAGLVIFPLVFANNLKLDSGPGLLFVTLPIAFGNMSGGIIIGALFFILVTFAALTSAISLLEPTVEFLEEKTPLNRQVAAVVGGVAVWLLGIACLLSFNEWDKFLIFGNNIFSFLDKITSKFMMPLGGLATLIFLGWFVKQQGVLSELNLSDTAAQIWSIVLRFVAPIGIIVIFIASLLS
ncbi:sodium-dependent transporter [Stenoxybacter acetivorans]|uniref:sodium-dependent transporter n=1 Tax=Stenoxybacter acetivorans TaxID=422441 RepID=UPI000563E788|nr:sodium-dependent transporter [Stenoxybacter acetivorans]